jgi:HD-GYP domain-containing protein (c-di-GMP phosphodiesterase class II)
MLADPASASEALLRQLAELNEIGAALSAERDTSRLLDLILTKAREMTASDAGSVYTVESVPSRDGGASRGRLRFRIAQNDSFQPTFAEAVLDITHNSIAGHVALSGDTVMLDDAYVLPPEAPYTFDRSFDEADGYRTRSVLAVPMRTQHGGTIGVLQLINAMSDGSVVPYSERQVAFVRSLASQAAVALENSLLYAEIRELFEGFVRAAIVAIEARDPATSGHSFRVANLTVALAEAVNLDERRFAAVHFSREEMRTIRYAALLHDFGKVGVPEAVLVKAKKLYPRQLDLVRERFKLARRSRELASMQARLDCALECGADVYREREPIFDAELAEALGEMDLELSEVERANEPTLLREGSFERLPRIASMTFTDADGVVRPFLTDDEVHLLSLRKGTLSPEERAEIEAHVLHSFRFLSQIPWTREIRRIPEIAVGHHEKLNGTGYPHQRAAADIPIETRIMTIADIFDALAAGDRPYKKAVPVERALEILGLLVKNGELDADLFNLFVETRVYERLLVEPYPY